MKTKLFLSALCFFSVAMSYLPSGFAQTKDLPAGARARLGEKYRCSNIAGAVESKWLITPVNYLWDFDYSPDGRFLVVADSYAYEGISLYDAKTAQKLRAGAAWSRIRSVVFSPDGKTIAAGQVDGDISLIDTATLSPSPVKHRPRTPLGTANLSIVWLSLDRSTLAWARVSGWGMNSRSINLSDLRGGSRRTISGHTTETKDGFPFILSVGFDSEALGRKPYTMASASQDGIIHLWDADDGSHLQKFTQYVSDSSWIDGEALGDPGHWETVISEVNVDNHNGREYWRTDSPDLPSPPGPEKAVFRSAVISLRDDYSADGRHRGQWQITSHIEAFHNLPLDSFENPANIIHLRETTYEWNPHEGALGTWILDKGNIIKHTFQGHTGCVWNVVYGEDGEKVASASVDGTIRTWNVGLSEQNQRFASHTKFESHTLHFSNIAFSRNRKALAIGHNNGAIQLWVNGTWWPAFKAHDGPISSLAFHPWWEPFEVTLESGEVEEVPVIPTLASASTDGTVRLWRLDFGSQELRPRTEGWVFYIKRLGSEEDFKRVSILRDPLMDVERPATSVAFSPDGSTLAIGSWRGVKVVKLWTARHSAPPIIYSKPVMSVAFSSESQTVAAGCLDGTIRLGAMTGDGRAGTLTGHTGSVFKVMFSPDGKTLASGSDDGTVLLWDHEPSTFRIIRGSKPLPSEDEETETETDEETETETDEETEAPSPGEDAPTPEDINADEDAADPSPEENAPTPEDVNGDGVVNIQDLVLVSANMGTTGENPADVNGDGIVNIQDLVLVANALGETQEAPAAE